MLYRVSITVKQYYGIYVIIKVKKKLNAGHGIMASTRQHGWDTVMTAGTRQHGRYTTQQGHDDDGRDPTSRHGRDTD